MRNNLGEELAEFRREVKAVLDTALMETDAPLAPGDRRRGPQMLAPFDGGAKSKSASYRVCTAAEGSDMRAVDRELALLEQSNAALFAALAQTRTMPMKPLPVTLNARTRALEAEEEARASLRRLEAAGIKERERMRKLEKRQLVERTRDLKQTVLALEREKMMLIKRLEDKRRRREQRHADARQREEKRRRDEETRALRYEVGYTAKEAELLRARLKTRAEEESRARAREALWRWRACAAASAAARERKERLAVEQAMAISRKRSADWDVQRSYYATERGNSAGRYVRAPGTNGVAEELSWTRRKESHGGGEREHENIRNDNRSFREETERGGHAYRVFDDPTSGAKYSSITEIPVAPAIVTVPERQQRRGRVQEFTEAKDLAERQEPGGAFGAPIPVPRPPRENSKAHGRLPTTASDWTELQRETSNGEGSTGTHTTDEAVNAAFRQQSGSEESRWRTDEQVGRAWRMTKKKRAKALARSLALILRAGLRVRKRQRLQSAFSVLKRATVATRLLQEDKGVHKCTNVNMSPLRVGVPTSAGTRSLVRQTAVSAAASRDRLANAASDFVAIFDRYRRSRLRRGFDVLGAVVKEAVVRERRVQRTRLLATREERASKTLLLTKSWAMWKAFTAAKVSARMMKAGEERARSMEAEKRHLRAERLAWVCKTALTAADKRFKARAWRLWRQFQGGVDRRNALLKRVLVNSEKRRRASRLRLTMCKWNDACESLRKHETLACSRLEKLRSVFASLRIARTPQVELTRAFKTWTRVTEAEKVAFLQRRQAARMLSGILKSSRRDLLASAMDSWKSASARRAQGGRCLQNLASRIARRQRVFFLNKAWSRIMWAAGERETARARQLGAARALHSLLASAARASRRRAWLRWKQVVAAFPAERRLQRARRTALRRCQRARLLRNMRCAWETLLDRARRSSALVSGAERLGTIILRSRQRALAGRLRVWRSASLNEAIATRENQTVRDCKRVATRLLVSTTARVQRRRLELGWRTLTTFAAENRRAEEDRVKNSQRMSRLIRMALERSRRRMLARVWRAWLGLLEERRVRGAVGAATSSLEGQRVSLARLCHRLKMEKGGRLIVSVTEQWERARLRRGWQALHQATRRRAILVRSVTALARSRLDLLRRALYHWRVVAIEARAANARVAAGRPVLTVCFAGASRRLMQPAWESWCSAVKREREENEFGKQAAAWVTFAAVISRVANRKDRERQARAVMVWRLGVARSAVSSAQAQILEERNATRDAESAQAELRVLKTQRQAAGARIALRWFRRQHVRRELEAWSRWTAATAEDRRLEEVEAWRARASLQVARELARVVERRHQRILRRSLQHWYRNVEGQVAHTATVGQEVKSREAGTLRLRAVLERNLLGRKARAWARFVGAAIAASRRREQELEAQRRQDLFVAAAGFRTSRRLLSRTWLAWKGIWAEVKHMEEVRALRAERAASALYTIISRREDVLRRFALVTWRTQASMTRERERGISAIVLCLMRSRARTEREITVRCLAQWRLVCSVERKATTEEQRVSAEAIVKGQAVAEILRRRRLQRLSEGFRHLIHHSAMVVFRTKEAQVRRDNTSRGLRSIQRVLARRSERCLMVSFVRWRWNAAGIGQQSDRALLVSAQWRAGAQILGAIFARNKMFALSRAWSHWRSNAATAAVHDGERASANLRVSDARRSMGIRLMTTTMCSARRRVLSKAWSSWLRAVRDEADARARAREKYASLARTLMRVEKRNRVEKIGRAWRRWNACARIVTRLDQILRRARRVRQADAMNRWRLASLQHRQTVAEERRAVAESMIRARTLAVLAKGRRYRQLRQGFHRLVEHGAWAIYWSKERIARRERQSHGFQVLGRTIARLRERSKLAAMSRWRSFAAESSRRHDKALLHAAAKRSGAKTLVALISRRSYTSLARAWAMWRSTSAAAGAQEGERASANLRVSQANRDGGVRLLVGALCSARRRSLIKAWIIWGEEARTAAEHELRSMEKYLHLARTLHRVNRRAQLTKMDRAWWEWRETVRIEGDAEVQAMERHYNIAQTVTRVMKRVERRRLARAWGVWGRLAARGLPRVSASLPSFPIELRAAARSAYAPFLALAKMDAAASPVSRLGRASDQNALAERSRVVRHRAGAVAMRGILRRSVARSLLRSWRTWRAATATDVSRKAKRVFGEARLSKALSEVLENYHARVVRRSWKRWVAMMSMAESARLEQAENAAFLVLAETEDKNMKASTGAQILARVTRRRETRALHSCLIAWVHVEGITTREGCVTDSTLPLSRPSPNDSEVINTARRRIARRDFEAGKDHAVESSVLREKRYPVVSPTTVNGLRRKLRGEASPTPRLPRAPIETKRSPRDMAWDGSPPYSGREVGVVKPSGDDGNRYTSPTSSQARPWGGDTNTSSHDLSPNRPPTTSLAGRSLSEGESSATAGDDDHGSLGLSTSLESGVASAPRSGGRAVTKAFASGSPAGSLEFLSDSSPLVGVRILHHSGYEDSAGRDGRGALELKRLDGEWAWHDGDGDTVVQPPEARDFATVAYSPEHSRGRRHLPWSDEGVDMKNVRLVRSPPYVGGSVHAGKSPPRVGYEGGGVKDEGKGGHASESGMYRMLMELQDEAPTTTWEEREDEASEEGGVLELSSEDEAGRTEAFVTRISAIFWRRAFKHWGRVQRDEAYRRRVMGTNRNVNDLRRNMKLRRVVVSAIRRQSYAWHINDLTRAMRRWREFVRKVVDHERFSLEISRMSSISPFTPVGPRSFALGLDALAISESGDVPENIDEATAETGDDCMPTFSPTTADVSSARRRLWDST